MMPSGIPARHRLRLRGGELLVELPLQPAVEIHRVRMLGDELGDTVSAGMLQRLGPLMPVAAVLFGQRAPGGEVVERGTLPGAERRIRQLAARRPRNRIDQLQGRPLGRPCGVTVDGVQLWPRVSGRRRAAAAPGRACAARRIPGWPRPADTAG